MLFCTPVNWGILQESRQRGVPKSRQLLAAFMPTAGNYLIFEIRQSRRSVRRANNVHYFSAKGQPACPR
jgi:hypothetical protein